MALAIGVDVGGTKVAAGVVDPDGTIVARMRRETPSDDPVETEQVIAEAIVELRRQHEVVAVGIGAAGFVDAGRQAVLFAPNLAWRDEPLRDRLEETCGVPVFVENDANAAAWGEHRFGAGRGADHVLVITVGTGIGGGLILDGRLYRGAAGIAGEPGHMRVVPDGHPCGCGQRGCFEQYASGRALTRFTRERLAGKGAAAQEILGRAGGSVDDVTGEHVTLAAQAGDPLAVELLAMLGHWLGAGLASLAAVLDPARIVVGGGVTDAGELLLGPARSSYAEHLTGATHRPVAPIVAAELGNDAGLVGAADLARIG
jgi:glucokinase